MAEKVAIEDTFEAPVEERRRTYETTLVLSAKAGDEARESVVGKIKGFVNEQDGEIIEVTPAKEFQLAYAIEKEQQGVMRTLVYKSGTELPNALAKELRHNTTVLRILTIEQPKRTPEFTPGLRGPVLTAEEPAISPATPPTETPAKSAEQMEEQIEGAISNL